MSHLERTEVSDAHKMSPSPSAIERDCHKHFAPLDQKDAAQTSLRKELLDKGVMPAMSKDAVPATSGEAAKAMAHKNLGFPTDNGKSSATSVSRILQASGLDVKITPTVPELKSQLESKGYKSHDLKPGEKLKSGDVVFTGMEPAGRNVGIVGSDGKIYSHDRRTNQFVGHDKWTSRFTTVMRRGSH